ncbi:MAG TPA: hypothetical protein VK880_08950, partial [Anaerolineales bacterium]|nr:hypothetical protein [Anaerolineales bacterium]
MTHPLAFIPNRYRKQLFFILLALTLILFAVLRVLDQPLRTDAAPKGIVSFELAGNSRTARAITDSWKQMSLLLSAVEGQPNPDVVNVPYVFAAFGLGLDYLFMPVYALWLAFGTLLASGKHEGWLRSLGTVAGYAALAAMVFDAVENYALLQVLLGNMQSPYPALAAFCAIVKFSLILLGLLYVLGA